MKKKELDSTFRWNKAFLLYIKRFLAQIGLKQQKILLDSNLVLEPL